MEEPKPRVRFLCVASGLEYFTASVTENRLLGEPRWISRSYLQEDI